MGYRTESAAGPRDRADGVGSAGVVALWAWAPVGCERQHALPLQDCLPVRGAGQQMSTTSRWPTRIWSVSGIPPVTGDCALIRYSRPRRGGCGGGAREDTTGGLWSAAGPGRRPGARFARGAGRRPRTTWRCCSRRSPLRGAPPATAGCVPRMSPRTRIAVLRGSARWVTSGPVRCSIEPSITIRGARSARTRSWFPATAWLCSTRRLPRSGIRTATAASPPWTCARPPPIGRSIGCARAVGIPGVPHRAAARWRERGVRNARGRSPAAPVSPSP